MTWSRIGLAGVALLVLLAISFHAWRWWSMAPAPVAGASGLSSTTFEPVQKDRPVSARPAPALSGVAASSAGGSNRWLGKDRSSQIGSSVIETGFSGDKDELRRRIAETTPFSVAEARRIRDPEAFLRRIEEIEHGNHYESDYLQAPHRYPAMNFVGGDLSTQTFHPDNGRIFARLQSGKLQGDSVLVKWYDPQSGESLYFDQYQVNAQSKTHSLWLDHKKTWEAGQYHVEVFSTDESLRLLSAGTFYVDQQGR